MSEFPISSARARSKLRPTWTALAIAIVAVAFWSLCFAVQQDVGDVRGGAALDRQMLRGLGVAAGAALGGAVVAWLVLYFALVRGIAPRRGLVHLAILAATALVIATPVVGFKVLAAAHRTQSAAFEEVRLSSIERLEAYEIALFNERNEIVADGFFGPNELAEPGGLTRARRKVVQLRTLYERLKADTARLDAETRRTIEALPTNERTKRAALADYELGLAEGRAEAETDRELTMAAFDELDGQLDVLSRQPRAWEVQYGQLAFRRAADLAAFNAHAARFAEISRTLDTREAERLARRRGRTVVTTYEQP